MATTTPRGKTAATPPRRQVSPLLIVIPLLAIAVIAMVTLNMPSARGPAPLATLTTQDFHSLAWSPTEADTVFFGHHDGMLVSRDGGATWQPASLNGVDAMSLATAPTAPQRMYAAGHGAFYRSDDSGASWSPVPGPLQTADIHGFAVSPEDADRLYAFVADQGLLTSSDGGSTWQPLMNAPTRITALAAGAGQTLYAGGIQGIIYTSADGGASWQQENIGMSGDVSSLVYEPESNSVIATAVMAGSNQGMLHRRAASGGWSMTSLEGMGIPLALSIDPQNTDTLLLVNNQGEVYRSTNGGASWGSS